MGETGQVTCPVCRLAQPANTSTCTRCGADLSLLDGVYQEAAAKKEELYRTIASGDTLAALTLIDDIVTLIGPSVELATLRRLLRFGVVPVEILDDLEDRGADSLTLAAYDAGLPSADDPQAAARQAFDDLCPADSSPSTDSPTAAHGIDL